MSKRENDKRIYHNDKNNNLNSAHDKKTKKSVKAKA